MSGREPIPASSASHCLFLPKGPRTGPGPFFSSCFPSAGPPDTLLLVIEGYQVGVGDNGVTCMTPVRRVVSGWTQTGGRQRHRKGETP